MSFSKKIVQTLAGLSLFFLFTATSCDDENGPDNSQLNFDQQAMLTNIGQNIVLPAYEAYKEETSNLKQAVTAFTNDPTEETIAEAQDAFKEAYIAWQGVTLYEFGPAEEVAFRMNSNAFPTSLTKIENSVSSNSWNLGSFTNVNQKGLPALDYLLFKEGALADFTTAENAANRRQYLMDVATNLHDLASQVYNSWNPQQENYLATFTASKGSSAGSSLSLLVNQLNEGFEITKNKRLNIPRGGRSIDEKPIPTAVEAYYSGISLDLVEANLNSVEKTFKGEAKGTDGLGLDDNLKAHFEAGNTEKDQASQILEQIAKVRAAVDAIPDPLSEAVKTSNDKVTTAYNETVKLVSYLKTEMPQTLSVLISYIDNDGD